MDRRTFEEKTRCYQNNGKFVRGNEFVKTPNIVGLARNDDFFCIYTTDEKGQRTIEAITEDKQLAYILVCDALGIELSVKDSLKLTREVVRILATRSSDVKMIHKNIDDNTVGDKVYRITYDDMVYFKGKWKRLSTKSYPEVIVPSSITQNEFYELLSILRKNMGDIDTVEKSDVFMELLKFYNIYEAPIDQIVNRDVVELDLHTDKFNPRETKKRRFSYEYDTDDVSISKYGKSFNDSWYNSEVDTTKLNDYRIRLEESMKLTLK